MGLPFIGKKCNISGRYEKYIAHKSSTLTLNDQIWMNFYIYIITYIIKTVK